MRDIIEKLKKIENEYGYMAFLEHYKPSAGHYFKVNKDNTISYYHSTGKKDDTFLLEDDYSFFKERLFFEGMLSSNKCIDASNKKIHSVTPYAMIFKYGIFEDAKLIEKGLSIKDVLNKHLELIESLNNNNLDIESNTDKFVTIFEYVKDSLIDICKKDDKILIFLDEEVDEYKKYYYKYLEEKIFIKNDTVIEIEGVKYGVPSFSITLNDKKPTLSKNTYNKYPYRISLDEALLLNYLNKIKSNTVNELLLDNENDFYGLDVLIDLNPNTKSKEIVNYNLNYDNKEYERDLSKFTILQSEYINEKPIVKTSSREDLLNEMDWIFNLEENSYLFNRLLKIRNGDYKEFNLKCKTNAISQLLISNKDNLQYYFKEKGDILIDEQLGEILLLLYKELFNEGIKPKKLRISLDFMLSALDYLNKYGGYDRMTMKIKDIWQKLVKGKEDSTYEIESNEEFFFVSGQLLYWLSTLSQSANNTSGLLQDVLEVRSSTDIKNYTIEKYRKYAYCIPVHSLTFINVLYNAVLTYEIDKEIKLKDFKDKYYYHSGLIGKNIKFVSVKKGEFEEENIDEE